MSFFIMQNQLNCLQNLAKGHKQLVAEQRDRADRIAAQIATPGYCRVRVQEPDGSESLQYVYAADYLQYKQSDRAWKLYKAMYLVFLIISVILSVLTVLSSSVLNSIRYVSALEIVSFIPLLYLIYTMFHQMSAPRRMETGQYKIASKNMKTGAFVYGLFLIASLAAMLVYVIANGVSLLPADMFCMAGPLLSAILIFLIFGLETKRRYIYVQNVLPDNMEIIDC